MNTKEPNTNSTKVYFINIDKIIKNEQNDVYKNSDITELKNSIMRYGLKQPISVIKQD